MEADRWIFLRGLGREQGHWEEFPALFESQVDAQVTCLDLPGSGDRREETAPLTISATVDALRAVAPPGRKFLFAVSLGGMVATEWANRFPDEIKGIVLVNSSFKSLSPVTQRLAFKAWPWLLTTIATASPAARERRILERTAPSQASSAERVKARVDIFHARPMSRANLFRQLAAAVRFSSGSRAPAVPSMVLYSEQDALVDPRCSIAISRAWKSVVHAHPTAGHDLPLEDPQWCCRAVKDWLSHF